MKNSIPQQQVIMAQVITAIVLAAMLFKIGREQNAFTAQRKDAPNGCEPANIPREPVKPQYEDLREDDVHGKAEPDTEGQGTVDNPGETKAGNMSLSGRDPLYDWTL